MKANTIKLYEKMKPRELAAIYHQTYDLHERSKIASAVPKYDYRCIDSEFVDQVDALRLVSLWWISEWWKARSKLNEELHELAMFGGGQKVIANLYVSRMKALENALTAFDLDHIHAVSDIDINADDLVKVYELELLPDHVDKLTDSIVSIMAEALAA